MRARIEPFPPPILALICASLLAFGFPSPCLAEIYGWVDPNGNFTYSNLPPPENARVTDVIAEEPARPSAAVSHQAEINALNDRIRLLELERARDHAQPVDFPAPPVYMPPPPAYGCGPDAYVDCSAYLGPYYTTAIAPVYYGNRMRVGGYGAGRRVPGAPSRTLRVAAGHAGGVRR